MYYVRHGSVPQQRHTQLRKPDGSLYAEELFGVEGFTGRSSLLYHLVPPTQTYKVEAARDVRLEAADEHAPYSQRDLEAPDEVGPRQETGKFVIEVRSSDRITAYHYRHHPFDLIGWDGYLWPFRFNIANFQPITGRVHQPPPVHQTFQARNFVVCSFVPRKFDYHPLAIPAPYNHSNINSDEVIYYVAGNFMSRRGVDIASFTLHPAGIPHGPHPGTVEASIGKEGTEELAVMVDTFHPLHLTKAALELDDDRYPYSWLPSDDDAQEASELAERGPEAFPD